MITTILVDAVHCFVIPEKGVFKEMFEILEKFSQKKIILTNANVEERLKFGLDDLPYPLFTLEHSPEKTEDGYYEKMLSHFSLQKEEVIYFEHNEEAAKKAQSLGIKTYQYDKNKKDLKKLEEFLSENS